MSGTGRTAPDITYKKLDGSIAIIEVKTGEAVLSKQQKEIFPQIVDGSAVLLKSSADLLKEAFEKYENFNPGIPLENVKPGMSLREAGLPNGIEIRVVQRDGLK